jgi:hypothetical protein
MLIRWWRGEAAAQVPGVNVDIENAPTSGVTDGTGTFRLQGNQFGPATLRFSGNGADGRLAVVLPGSGFLRFVNVEVSGADVSVDEIRTEFRGPLTGIACSQNLLQVLAGDLVALRVRLVSGTVIQDRTGQRLRCQDLTTSHDMRVLGSFDSAGDVTASLIDFDPPRGPRAVAAELDGTIDTLDCPTEITLDRGAAGKTHVEIDDSTEIRGSAGKELSCPALNQGNQVHVEGLIEGGDVTSSLIQRISSG